MITATCNVYYHHTDCGGVVYYAKYLEFLEEARTEFFAACGLSVKGLMDRGLLFMVVRQEIDYMSPARYGDTLEITTTLEKISLAKLVFAYAIYRQGGALLVTARTVLGSVGSDGKPCRIPDEISEKIAVL